MPTVTLDATTTGDTLSYIEWSFGDGTDATSAGTQIVHIYPSESVYKTDATFHSVGLATGTATHYLFLLTNANQADFTASPRDISSGQNVQFTDLSTGNPTSWYWTYDGTFSILQNPSRNVVSGGTVTLQTTYASDQTNLRTKTGYITVGAPA